jgi:hypothetical protein
MTVLILPPDFNDMLSALDAEGARYLVVGGYALAFYALPRATKDFDIWIDPTPTNARRVYAALAAFGAPLSIGVRIGGSIQAESPSAA